uniref:Reverse transcriptase homolog n=2 Tax=Pavlovaceae TaxID=418969 RepID=O99479_DIALT|nr:reverse transcriptase homolog [Diacronema lutheri]ADW83098.1 hypothetical protein [Diacronema lutheri]QHD45373.1 hypothetical protein [Pavlova sp. NIVA-4/92]|mmetsp:Transcript_5314/g.16694  ORF Transcript_5314/g.16694 Transcript_5314/m.16694 type:complete len:637 (-) Transcript_5314:112-2022(-)
MQNINRYFSNISSVEDKRKKAVDEASVASVPAVFVPLSQESSDNFIGNPISYTEIYDLQSLRLGLEATKSSAAPGLDGDRKANFSEAKLVALQAELISQKYQPKTTKRVAIPKPNGGIRYLGISSQRDKIVQASIQNALQSKYGKHFSPDSFGFRPGLGCHDALKHVRNTWQNITWIISIDIEKCFDTINHTILLQILRPLVDQPTLELISKLIKVGYVEMFDTTCFPISESTIGTPQGSLISPLLCNFYMHILDTFLQKVLIPQWNVGDERSYVKGCQNRKAMDVNDKAIVEAYPELEGQIQRIKHNRWVTEGKGSRDPNDANFRRLRYVRYADDIVIGFTGPYSEALVILDQVVKFLEKTLCFKVNKEKSSINHSETNGIKFLGTFIKYLPNKIVIDPKHDIPGEIQQLKAVAINKPQLRAPIKDILERAVSNGFAKLRDDGSIRATSCRKLSSLEDKAIVLRFSSIIRGILNYYSFVNSRSDLWPVVSLFRKSCALTLADKHKLKTAAAVYKRYGPNLKVQGPVPKDFVILHYPDTLKTTQTFKLGKRSPTLAFIDDLGSLSGSYRSLPKTSDQCQFPGCGAKEGLEEHHVNPQANISNKLSAFEKSLIAKKRKTITLCRAHHLDLHRKNVTE